ncbi:Gfo/Idh/MocA family protein [Trabulsiella odontotermitis]|uniref:Oxidoreductase n=1 Tax=Trabulsiella odontotermitis TaxID=379893 RepID=A0A0L0GZX2_9ENTR|nr:Gfo/Idh/MocA family oxidoreductase [Trabulsiella odontotermitis]KNC94294.1 oxidoreductase [Trabulsiella odontotermitis]
MTPLNAAIIGCGAIHRHHVDALRQLPDVELRAIAGVDAPKGERLAQEYGCRFYRDYREMLQARDIHVVHICTPHYLHKPMIIAALAAGKQVFSEKPVAMNGGDITEIRRAVQCATGRLGVCYQNRFNPTSQATETLLAAGTLGEMLSIKAVLTWSRSDAYYRDSNWRGRFATEGGSLLINQAIHTLDLMQWFGGGVKRLKGIVDNAMLTDATEAEDSAMATFEFHNGARGLFYASNTHTCDSPLLLEIHCQHGTLRLQDNILWLFTRDGQRELARDTTPDGNKGYWGTGHQQAIAHFYHALRYSTADGVMDIDAAARSLHLVEAIYRSSQLRRWINLTDVID